MSKKTQVSAQQPLVAKQGDAELKRAAALKVQDEAKVRAAMKKRAATLFELCEKIPRAPYDPANSGGKTLEEWAQEKHWYGVGLKFAKKFWRFAEPSYWTITRVDREV